MWRGAEPGLRSSRLVAPRLPGKRRASLSYPPRPAGQAVTCPLGLAHSLPDSLLTCPLLGPPKGVGWSPAPLQPSGDGPAGLGREGWAPWSEELSQRPRRMLEGEESVVGHLALDSPPWGPPEASSIREGSGPHASHQPASLLYAADSQNRGLPGEVRTAAGAPGRMG